MDYENDVKIDENALDIEWLDQTRLALSYGRFLVNLKKRLKAVETRKKVKRSELILEVNKNPNLVEKSRPNKEDIEAYYRTHPDYRIIEDEYNELLSDVEFAEIAKNEICFTRKMALENLVVLHGQQYFAGPRVPRNIGEEWQKHKVRMKSSATKQTAEKAEIKKDPIRRKRGV